MSKAKELLSSLCLDNESKDKVCEEMPPRRPAPPVDITKVLENRYFQIAEIAGNAGAILEGVEYLDHGASMRFSGEYNERKMVGLLNEEFLEELVFRSFRDIVIVEVSI